MSTTATHETASASSTAAQPAAAVDAATGTTPLSRLRRGQRARIRAIATTRGDQLAARLTDLGLEPGREVTVVRRAPLGDPTVYAVASYHLSLRRRDAELVVVDLLEETR